MVERVRNISFRDFRGLPNYRCELQGKSIGILGGTGKGKSAIVDGIEFLFGGYIRRFHGEGSGNIDEGKAIRHILAESMPTVEIYFTPTNDKVARRWNEREPLKSKQKAICEYVTKHPPVESFILRRSQLLEFIRAQEAKRYQSYIGLLGLDSIDAMQKNFNQAETHAQDIAFDCSRKLNQLLQLFRDYETQWGPVNTDDILSKCSGLVVGLGLSPLKDWSGLDEVVPALDAKRSSEARRKLDQLSAAINRLETPLPEDFTCYWTDINETHAELRKMQAESEETGKAGIIKEGLNYFRQNPNLPECPLCEQTLEDGYAAVFARLSEREAALAKLRGFEVKRAGTFDKVSINAQRVLDLLDNEVVDHSLYPVGTDNQLLTSRQSLEKWLDGLKSWKDQKSYEDIIVPPEIEEIRLLRSKVCTKLTNKRNKLIKPESATLEKAIIFLHRAQERKQVLMKAEQAYKQAKYLEKAAKEAKEAFSEAREEAIQQIFNKISKKVLFYYHKLHNFEDGEEKAECTGLTLDSMEARAAAGGLRLAVDFLNRRSDCDPQTFLSEGHLDSLGLCLFLGTVRLFNPPGSLLVLDDILTSVDKEHRHRVIELILEEFSDFQLIITTHDEYWFNCLKGSTLARGVQKKWCFETISRWTLERGPESANYEGTWDWIESNLKEQTYRELGGSLRLVFEDFLKRVAEKINLYVPYRRDGRYTAADFWFRGINMSIRTKLLETDPNAKTEILRDVQRVFGNGDFINFLSHDNPGRLEIQLGETKDFVTGLKSLINRCEKAGIIKGVSQ